jgi:two-component system, chemotaxis family, chemotaxis protein CheY
MSDNVYASLTVMTVDDEAFSRSYIARILLSIGIDSVIPAENGTDALAKLERLEGKLDLIICDIEMPEMGGYEFVRRLRYGAVEAFKNTPVVMLTGNDTEKNVRSAKIHKISGFLVKPPEVESLKSMIDQVMSRR